MPESSVFSKEVPGLFQSHFESLHKGSAISVEVIKARGYKSVLGKTELRNLGFSPARQRPPGILIPLHGVGGGIVGYQYRPDNPRLNAKGKPAKYETPSGASNRVDCPPLCHPFLGDPAVPLWITEGVKKADALASQGVCAIALPGVWNWRGKNEVGGLVALPDLEHIAFNERTVYLAFDSDTWTNRSVKAALLRLAGLLEQRHAQVPGLCCPSPAGAGRHQGRH